MNVVGSRIMLTVHNVFFSVIAPIQLVKILSSMDVIKYILFKIASFKTSLSLLSGVPR